jgi:hypothetical protein
MRPAIQPHCACGPFLDVRSGGGVSLGPEEVVHALSGDGVPVGHNEPLTGNLVCARWTTLLRSRFMVST